MLMMAAGVAAEYPDVVDFIYSYAPDDDLDFDYRVNSFTMSPDGRYISASDISYSTDEIDQWTLTTPYDISTAVRGASYYIGTLSDNPYASTYDDTGDQLFVASLYSNPGIQTYDLSIPYTGAPIATTRNLHLTGVITYVRNVAFSADGLIMFVLCNLTTNQTTSSIAVYYLSTPWDLSTTAGGNNYDQVFQMATNDTMTAISLSPDGKKLVIAGRTTQTLRQWNLSEAWDLSSRTEVASLPTSPIAEPIGFHIDWVAKKLYILNFIGTHAIHELGV